MKSNFINTDEYPEADRQYKDRLFRFVFQKPEDLLSLYNAVNGTDYKDPDALEINTLGNVLYLSMKNDISFLVSGTLNLYEHQSTCNPNMPMRGLFYFSRLYEKYIAVQDINIYSSAAKTFPFPRHVVFYNGTAEEPDRKVLRLSDLYEIVPGDSHPSLECETLMLNINYGHNRSLMEKCRRLEEYAIFVHTVRENLERQMTLDQAVTEAVDTCIRDGVLKDILTEQKSEVIQMVLETFDQEKYEKAMHQEGYDDGYSDGKKDGYSDGKADMFLELIRKKLAKGSSLEKIARELETDLETVQKLADQI
ncbi:RpnC/YadD family protein [Claveliimonas monacensis]|uniref:hypothetical protein n=1 Tax=Claveliimonas monacensis TaxID=2779351 RepID=UPI001CF85F63|nr:hypothetical protein [Claveliimonas monacensis]